MQKVANIHNKNQKIGRGSRLLEDQKLLSELFLSGMRDDLELFLTSVETPLAPPPINFQPHVAQGFRVEMGTGAAVMAQYKGTLETC